ncbi:MAG: PD-(D/E)XK nuclease family protein [Thermosynechococcaceae cyanobacterium]
MLNAISTPIWQLSQSHLNQLSECPRQFQYRYLEQWGLPTVAPQPEQQSLGTQFHHLLQQRSLGLNIQPFLDVNKQLRQWFETLDQSPPPLIAGNVLSEYQQLLPYGDFTLVAVYDRLIQNSQQAQILDWKTYTRPRNLDRLRQDWQTRLYPYMLVENSSYAPEQVAMVYWFAQAPGDSHTLVLPYDTRAHRQTHQDLTQMLAQLSQALAAYVNGQNLEQIAIATGRCDRCPFFARCRGGSEQPEAIGFDDIAEVPI